MEGNPILHGGCLKGAGKGPKSRPTSLAHGAVKVASQPKSAATPTHNAAAAVAAVVGVVPDRIAGPA
jgi:hypothetical protein